MVNLDNKRSDRHMPGSLLNDVWGIFNELDRNFFVPVVQRAANEITISPACDVTETENSFALSFDVPGLKKEEINIEITGRQLAISGERKREEDILAGSTHRIERKYGRFHRVFELPEGTNVDAIEASYESGVLKLAIPKSESISTRKIQINDSGKGLFKRLVGKQEAKAVNA